MTIDQIQSQSEQLANDIKRHQVLGTDALPLDEIYDHLMSVADGPDAVDVECHDCEGHVDDLDSISDAIGRATLAPTLLDCTTDLMTVFVRLGESSSEAAKSASALIEKIRSLTT